MLGSPAKFDRAHFGGYDVLQDLSIDALYKIDEDHDETNDTLNKIGEDHDETRLRCNIICHFLFFILYVHIEYCTE